MPDSQTLLVLESQASLAKIIRLVLAQAGVEGNVTESPAQFQHLLATNSFDAVLVEVQDLIFAEAELRHALQVQRTGGTFVGVMSTSAERSVTQLARENLWDFAIIKPFSSLELRRKLRDRGLQLTPMPEGGSDRRQRGRKEVLLS
jgi:DNA-binding response OmpR family regulator